MIPRLAALGALALGALLAGLVLLGGDGGRRVDRIDAIELTGDNQARVAIEVEEPFAPLREGARGVIRATSLSGVANRYIALTLAPENARALDDGATLTAERTTSIVHLEDLAPLQQLDPVIPILQYVKPFKRELTAFFANSVAATQADVQPGTQAELHYLRTTNPVKAGNFAVYPRRVGSNRPLADSQPGAFDGLRDGLEVNEDRHCGRGLPVISQVADPVLARLVPDEFRNRIDELFLPVTQNAQQPAPACKLQAPQTFQGETQQYPHVEPRP